MKYREIPINCKTVEAVQFLGNSYGNLCAIGSMGISPNFKHNPLTLEIKTSQGIKTAYVGDYIVKLENGDFQVWDLDTFSKTFELTREE